jgi:5'-deoxynucleotidase YfbR-like HD superfamily hydrolase
MEQLDFIINGGETVRFHTWPVLRPQRVDSHSFHVAMLCALMAQDADIADGEGLSVPLLMAALTHDLAEWKFGDMPAPTKRELGAVFPGFRAKYGEMETEMLEAYGIEWESMLTLQGTRWLKLADAMQGCLYCIREKMMGNRLIATPFQNFRQYIRDVLNGTDPAPMEAQIINYIDDMWEQADG